MGTTSWRDLAAELTAALDLVNPPVAIVFSATTATGLLPFDSPMSSPTPDGRTGRVTAGCVFWMLAAGRTFTTVPEDHGNCSVGLLTHGLASPDEVAGNADVAELVGSGWLGADDLGRIPAVQDRAGSITYGPLAEAPLDPDVVLVRVDGRQLMVLADALPGLRLDGKPQCGIVAVAKEQGEVAASLGCALSRARTGMGPGEMSCAIPGPRLAEVVERVRHAALVDNEVAGYAAADARRFDATQSSP